MKIIATCLLAVHIALASQMLNGQYPTPGTTVGSIQRIGLSQFSQNPNTLYESFEEPIDWSNAQYRIAGDPSRGILPGKTSPYVFSQSGIYLVDPIPNNTDTNEPQIDIFPANLGPFGLGAYGDITIATVPNGFNYLIEAGRSNHGYGFSLPGKGASSFGGYFIEAGRYPGQDMITVYAYAGNLLEDWIGTAYVPAVTATEWKNNFFGFASTNGKPIKSIYIQSWPYTYAGHAGVDQLMFTPIVWAGGASVSSWSAGENWGGIVPPSCCQLKFGGLVAGGHAENINDLATGTQFNGIVFTGAAPSYNLKGNGIKLDSQIANQSPNNQQISLDLTLSGRLTIDDGGKRVAASGNISGTGPVEKSGAGTLVFSGNNSYSGGTIVGSGALEITSPNALPPGSSLSIGSGATVVLAPSAPGASSVPEPSTAVLAIAMAALLCLSYRRFHR